MKNLGNVVFGDVTIKILSNSNELTVSELNFPRGVSASKHKHVHEEVNYIVKGTFECECNGERFYLHEGEHIQVPSNIEHSLSCSNDSDGVVISVWTPSRTDLIAKIEKN